ncbi:MAG: ABC transporter substrate-binding protein, partial [Steroidobacteraceae bacterium]
DEYGVDPASVTYYTGGEEEPGREEKLKVDLPERIRVQAIGRDQTLARLIAEGEIDALYTARAPSTFHQRPNDVKRLFANYVEVEKAYFARTRIFPIMHVVVLRRDVYAANRWLAQSLCKAFVQAQRYTYDDLTITAALKTMLPWQIAAVEETVRTLGPAWWSYGFHANQHVLDTFLRYHFEQGLSERRLRPEEQFAPETLEEFKI